MTETLSIALSGLQDSVARVRAASQNIANAMTTGRLPATKEGAATSYTPKDVRTISNSSDDQNLGVRSDVIDRTPSYYPTPDPRSPYANDQGLVAAPNVDIAAELVSSKIASTAYAANAALIKTALENDKRLLDMMG